MEKINLQKLIKEMKKPWEPRNVVLVDETALRIAKIEGAYNWHIHREEDEFFLVLKGKIFIDTEEGSIELNEMEGYLVKKGTRHRSRTKKPAWILLIEPIKTKTKGE
ncbi:MAG: cupin domain-containing protein [Candidatus Cloacimonetes bacterium]|nr:cupin domain-containing protein [Candidatus Cloacimonadota bacterium]